MPVVKLVQLKKSFSEDQLRFLKEKKLEGTFNIITLLKFLNKLSSFDKHRDNWSKWLIGISVVTGLSGIGLGIFLENIIPFIVGGIFVIALIVYWGTLKRKDLHNNLRKFVIPFLGIIKEELDPKSKLLLSIEAEEPILKKYIVHEIPRESYYGRKITFYKYDWFQFGGVFLDQSKLTFEITDVIRKIDIKKRSRSGKTKYKTKYKKAVLVKVILIFKKSNYQLIQENLKDHYIKEERDKIIIKYKMKYKGFEKDEIFELNKFLNIIQRMYSTVKPTK